MPGSSTPTRDGRSQRLTSKPYDRPSSRPASAPSTPQRAAAPGLLRSLVDKLYSPFRSSREDDVQARQDDAEMALEPPPYGHRQPIQAIRDALVVSATISPEKSTQLLGDFYDAKRQLGQAGQQTPQEQEAIDELLRRSGAQPRHPKRIATAPSVTNDSPSVSRTGRGLFESPARRRIGETITPGRLGTPSRVASSSTQPATPSTSSRGSSGLFRSPRRYAGPGLPAARTTVASSLGRTVEAKPEPKRESIAPFPLRAPF